MFFFFFFQAEDGIRDVAVTGVQTCALPISSPSSATTYLASSSSGSAETKHWRRNSSEGFASCWNSSRSPQASQRSSRAHSHQGSHPQLPSRKAIRSLGDRKSTRLNSSHGYISYAVFCLKKKKR